MNRSQRLLSLTVMLLGACQGGRSQDAPEVARDQSASSATPAAPAPPSAEPTALASTGAEPSAAPSAPVTARPSAVAAQPNDPAARGTKAAPSATASAGPAPVAVEPPKPVETATPALGAAVGDTNFKAWMQGAAKQKAGAPGQVDVVLTASGDYHCNEKYPYRFKLDAAPAGVTYPEPVVRSISLGAARSVMHVPFVAATPGDITISGTFSFSVCTSSQCVVDSRKVALRVKIEGS